MTAFSAAEAGICEVVERFCSSGSDFPFPSSKERENSDGATLDHACVSPTNVPRCVGTRLDIVFVMADAACDGDEDTGMPSWSESGAGWVEGLEDGWTVVVGST